MPGHRLVEQEKARLRRQRHGNFKLPMFAMAQLVDAHVGALGEPDAGKRRQRRFAQFVFAARIAPETERMAAMRLHGERDILERGQVGEQRGDLKRTRQPEAVAAIDRQPRDVRCR